MIHGHKLIIIALFTVLVLIPTKCRAVTVTKLRIVGTDNSAVAQADVNLIADNGATIYIGTSSADGTVPLPRPIDCPPGGRLHVKPTVGMFTDGWDQCALISDPCKEILTSYRHWASLDQAFKSATSKGDRATAALVANEISARLAPMTSQDLAVQIEAAKRFKDGEVVEVLQRQLDAQSGMTIAARSNGWHATALILAGQQLGVKQPLDDTSTKLVMSSEMRKKITAFQASNKLQASAGSLDYRTLRTMSGKDIGTLTGMP